MSASIPDITASDGEPVLAKDMVVALTGAEFVYSNGAGQTFDPKGSTTYVEGGQPTHGEWAVVEDGRFSSFWPPSYRTTYDLRWLVKDGGGSHRFRRDHTLYMAMYSREISRYLAWPDRAAGRIRRSASRPAPAAGVVWGLEYAG